MDSHFGTTRGSLMSSSIFCRRNYQKPQNPAILRCLPWNLLEKLAPLRRMNWICRKTSHVEEEDMILKLWPEQCTTGRGLSVHHRRNQNGRANMTPPTSPNRWP